MLTNDEISAEEREAISQYKEYQLKHLPTVVVLKDLYAVNFDPEVYGDTIEGLQKYVDKQTKYTKHIKRAAYLRQAHYEQWIKNKREEDPKHQAWREGMNAIAADCEKKLEYWAQVYKERLDGIFNAADAIPYADNIDFTVRNCEYTIATNNTRDKNSTKQRKISRPPKISARERARMIERYRAQLLAKNVQEHKLLDEEMSKNSAYHQLLASYDIHKISSSVEVPTIDICDNLLRNGIDNPMTCKDFTLDYRSGVIPIGTNEEMVDLSLLLYTSISQISLQFCLHYKCIGFDDHPKQNIFLGDYKHLCDKCEIGEVLPLPLQDSCHRLDRLVHLINYILQTNPQSDIMILTLINCILADQRVAWNSYVIQIVMSMILAKMDDEAIISNINASIEKISEIRNNIRIISRLDIPIEIANASIKVTMERYVRMNQYLLAVVQIYPSSLYHDRISLMLRLIAEDDVVYGSKLIRGGKLFIDPPVINYAKIKRETGMTMVVPKRLIEKYNEVRKQYNAKLKAELGKLSGK